MTLIVVSGAPGTGKSTIAREPGSVASRLADRHGRRSTGPVRLPGRPRRWQAIGVPTRLVHLVIDPAEPAQVDRLLGLGAVHADIGQGVQGNMPWTVLADPEGSEFCVLSPR